MSLVCPGCSRPTLSIVDSVACGFDRRADENTVQRAYCAACDTCYMCAYRAVRSFNPDRDDRVSHVAYVADRLDWITAAPVFATAGRQVAPLKLVRVAEAYLSRASSGASGHVIRFDASAARPAPEHGPPTEADLAWLDRLRLHLRRMWWH